MATTPASRQSSTTAFAAAADGFPRNASTSSRARRVAASRSIEDPGRVAASSSVRSRPRPRPRPRPLPRPLPGTTPGTEPRPRPPRPRPRPAEVPIRTRVATVANVSSPSERCSSLPSEEEEEAPDADGDAARSLSGETARRGATNANSSPSSPAGARSGDTSPSPSPSPSSPGRCIRRPRAMLRRPETFASVSLAEVPASARGRVGATRRLSAEISASISSMRASTSGGSSSSSPPPPPPPPPAPREGRVVARERARSSASLRAVARSSSARANRRR